MKRFYSLLMMLTLVFASPAFATVVVSTPTDGDSVGSSVQFVANANTTTCNYGVAAMGVYVDNNLQYVTNGVNLNTTLNLSPGSHKAVVQAWDYCGGSTNTAMTLKVTNQSGVSVTSPANGATVSSPASYVATATTSCAAGVAKIGVYVDNQLAYTTPGAKLNTALSLGGGTHSTVVQSWDNFGGTATTPVQVSVGGTTITALQAAGGWNQWGELPPTYGICSAPCNGVNWSMYQNNNSVSLSGNSTQFNVGGSTAYSDVLWSNPVLGQGAVASRQDASQKLIPTLHNFTLDTEVFITNLSVTQDLEFDINMYLGGVGMEWGTECNHLADGVWDIWDNVDAVWMPTNVPCTLNNNAWNHVTVQVQREANNDLLYQTITVNGVTSNINRTVAPFQVPAGWYGMTVNYQMDGNHNMASNTTYVDNMNFTYW